MIPKIGRPKSAEPKTKQYGVRLNQDGVQKLQFVCQKLNKSYADVFRIGLDMVYEMLKK